tara:strand:+ start:301 stop:1002 length:702 start_codon:yes stop_codon:yes gene_type:complete
MKFLIIFFAFFIFCNYLLAGAPPMNKEPIPLAPYSFVKTNHIIIGVEWEKENLKKFLPSSLFNQSTITGGINIFNSKKKQDYSPLSGSYGWVDLPGDNKEKLIIFSIYGPNKTINNIMKSVYNLQSDMGSNKVTLINDNAIATASIRKKNVLSLSSSGSKDCSNASGDEILVTKYSETEKIYHNLRWIAEKQCSMIPNKLELKGSLEKFKVKKLLWAKTQRNSEVIFEEQLSK